MAQTCRVCGVRVPSGFINCDSCYYKTNEAKTEETKFLKHISKLEKLYPNEHFSDRQLRTYPTFASAALVS